MIFFFVFSISGTEWKDKENGTKVVQGTKRVHFKCIPVKDRYLKYEAAGDQFVGRCAACPDLLSKDFAISPPFWDFSASDDGEPHSPEEEVQLEQELESFLKERLPSYNNIRKTTLNVAQVLLATICYHHEYLKATLSQSSLVRASRIFRNIPI